MADQETYSFQATEVAETDLAILLKIEGEEHWIARSKLTDDGGGWYTIPEWLAIDNGIV